ncbi:MAG: hypothetical protein P8Z71_06985 [Candidatus Sulfobium sp.]
MLIRKRMSLLFMVMVFGCILFFNCREAVADGITAAANCDGICSAEEAASNYCANFGVNRIEFCGAGTAMCLDYADSLGKHYVPCTVYFYRYEEEATNQIDIAIPINLTQTLDDALGTHCSQYITDGSGDPTTGFGENLNTLGICRITPSGSSFPGVVSPVPNGYPNFWIQTDPSNYDKDSPLNWQVRYSKNQVYPLTLVGPITALPEVSEAGATITTKNGGTCTYGVSGGQPFFDPADCPQGTKIIPQSQTKICTPADGNDVSFTAPDGVAYHCETISYVSEKCDVKTTGTDPMRYVGGSWIYFPY